MKNKSPRLIANQSNVKGLKKEIKKPKRKKY